MTHDRRPVGRLEVEPDPGAWPALRVRMIDTMIRSHAAFRPRLDKVKV